jgi:DNA-directed RNA polymerase specialized sigma24 family protein
MSQVAGYNTGMPSSDFLSTHWSIVLRAGQAYDSDARDALAFLCQRYWYPLYVFVRKKGFDPDRAEDVTQGFFARLIEKHVLERAAPSRGRFRLFLLASLQNFLSNEWDQAQAQKRGGGRPHLSLDVEAGERKLRFEPSHELTPEKIFDRTWAVQLLELVVSRLRKEFADKGKAAEFDILQSFLAGKHADASYERSAAAMGMSLAAVRQAAHRLRKRYREVFERKSPKRSPVKTRSTRRFAACLKRSGADAISVPVKMALAREKNCVTNLAVRFMKG